jgi:hypothetical protein
MTEAGLTVCHHQPPPPVLLAHTGTVRGLTAAPNRRTAMGRDRGSDEELIYKTRAKRERERNP